VRSQTAQNCGAHSFYTRNKILTEITYKLTARKLQKIVNMNADISENIKDRELGFQI